MRERRHEFVRLMIEVQEFVAKHPEVLKNPRFYLRALIEQKRWKQLSRTQSDVHNKILDRFRVESPGPQSDLALSSGCASISS